MQLEKIIDSQETQSFQVLPHRWFVHFLFQHCKCDAVAITARRCLDFAKDGTHFAQMGLATLHISWRKRCLLATLLVLKTAFKTFWVTHSCLVLCLHATSGRPGKKWQNYDLFNCSTHCAPFLPRVLPGLFVFQHGLHNGSVILLGWFYSALTKNSCHLNTFFSLGGLQGSAKAPTQPYTVYPTLAQSKSTNVPWQNHGLCSVANDFALPTDFNRHLSIYLCIMYLFQAGGFVSFCANLATASAANLLQLECRKQDARTHFSTRKKSRPVFWFLSWSCFSTCSRTLTRWAGSRNRCAEKCKLPLNWKKASCTSPKMIRHT